MSSTVRPASSTAARIGVERELEAGPVDLAPDRGLADAGDDDAALEAVGAHQRRARDGHEARDGEPAGSGLEADVDLHADGDVLGRAPAEPAHDAHAGVVGELDEDDRVRHLEVGHPALVVDGEAVDDARPGDLRGAAVDRRGTSGRCPSGEGLGAADAQRSTSRRPSLAAFQNASVSSVTAGGMPTVASTCSPSSQQVATRRRRGSSVIILRRAPGWFPGRRRWAWRRRAAAG